MLQLIDSEYPLVVLNDDNITDVNETNGELAKFILTEIVTRFSTNKEFLEKISKITTALL